MMFKRRVVILYAIVAFAVLLILHTANKVIYQPTPITSTNDKDTATFQAKRPFADQNPDPHPIKDSNDNVSQKGSAADVLDSNTVPVVDAKQPEPKKLDSDGNRNKNKNKNTDNTINNNNSPKPNTQNTDTKKTDAKPTPEIPLYKQFSQDTVEGFDKMSLDQRVLSRHNRYEAYLKAFNSLPQEQKEEESRALELLYYGLEWRELDSFKHPIQWDPEDYEDGAIQPAGKKVLVLTANDGKGNTGIGGILEASRENRKEYCNFHGYQEYFVNLTRHTRPGVHPVWAKMGAIRESFEKFPSVEWVWWLDTDALIMNAEIDLAKHILNKRAMKERLTYGRPLRNVRGNWTNGIYMERGEVDFDRVDLIFTQDFYGFNAGSFFIRRSDFTNFLMDFWEDPLQLNAGWERREQDALAHMFFNHERYQQHFGLAPQRIMNAYTDNPEGVWTWQPGDLVIHLAGCSEKDVCEATYYKKWEQRIQVPEAYQLANRINLESFRLGTEKGVLPGKK